MWGSIKDWFCSINCVECMVWFVVMVNVMFFLLSKFNVFLVNEEILEDLFNKVLFKLKNIKFI